MLKQYRIISKPFANILKNQSGEINLPVIIGVTLVVLAAYSLYQLVSRGVLKI